MNIAFKPVVIMYNPVSTGPSKANAYELAAQIEKRTTNSVVKLTPTEYPGHAEKLAVQAMSNHASPLIISSSGDGAYHEMINGVMKTKSRNPKAVIAVLPSGNANDHHRIVHDHELIESILKNITKKIGLLELTVMQGTKTTLHRYAHSYIGFGVSSAVARTLNEGNKSPLDEKWASLKTFFSFRHIKVECDGKKMKLDSLLASNIAEMAKTLKIAKNVEPNHKTFGLSLHEHASKAQLLGYFVRAATVGVVPHQRVKEFEFRLLKKASLQMDGEVYGLNAGVRVVIKKISDALRVLG